MKANRGRRILRDDYFILGNRLKLPICLCVGKFTCVILLPYLRSGNYEFRNRVEMIVRNCMGDGHIHISDYLFNSPEILVIFRVFMYIQ